MAPTPARPSAGRVTRRLVGLFVACALLPVVITIALSYSRVHEALLGQRVGQLHEAAGAYGTSLIERLGVAELLARTFVEDLRLGRRPERNESIREQFRTAVISGPAGQRWVFGSPKRLPDLRRIEGLDARLAAGGTALAVSGADDDPRTVWLVRALAPQAGAPRVALELDPGYLWSVDENLPYATDICILDTQSAPIHCTRPYPDSALAAIQERIAADSKGDLAWQADGGRALVGFRELFLKGKFGAAAWYAVASQPEEHALAPLRSVRQLVVPVVVLGVLLAAFLGLVQVRRTLRPLKELTDATARIAARDFDARVPAEGDDEFGALARSFNTMSGRLGRQFHALEAHAEIDAVILSNVDLERVAAIVIARMAQVVHADRRVLLIADPEQKETYRVHGADAPDGADGNALVLPRTTAAQIVAAPAGLRARAGTEVWIGPLAGFGSGGVFILPVALGAELAGAVVVGYDEDRMPDAEEVSHLRALADRVAVALATARRDQELHRRAHFDALTQLPNRSLGLEELTRAVAQAKRRGCPLAVLSVGLDGFSTVKDSLGHEAGDKLLVLAAERLRACVRQADIVARLGGDEFAVMLPELNAASDAALVATHVIDALSRPFDLIHGDAFISASVGIAAYPGDAVTAEDLLRHADLAMYQAKAKGRGQVVFFESSMDAEGTKFVQLVRARSRGLTEAA
jgi:diguanylate cyclase (GGDEF)-like protein